ncbi:MAG TPA: energy transducer TonB [Roseateles sp.]
MSSPTAVCALALLALVSSSLQAQPEPAASEPAASAPPATRVVRLKAQSLRPGGTAYPAALAEQGVQGTAEVLVRIAPDGTPADVSLHATSRSAALDEQALAYVRGLRFGARSGAGSGALPDVILPVEFLRDTVEGLLAKTCAEFNIDKAYFKAAFPETEPSHMPVVRMTTGMLLLAGMPRQSGEALVAQARQLNAAAAGIESACEAEPEANYLKRFVELVKKAG